MESKKKIVVVTKINSGKYNKFDLQTKKINLCSMNITFLKLNDELHYLILTRFFIQEK